MLGIESFRCVKIDSATTKWRLNGALNWTEFAGENSDELLEFRLPTGKETQRAHLSHALYRRRSFTKNLKLLSLPTAFKQLSDAVRWHPKIEVSHSARG